MVEQVIATQRVDLVGIPLDPSVDAGAVCELLDKKDSLRLVTFITPDSWAIAKQSPEYLEALQRMTFNLTDKAEVAWLCRRLASVPCARVHFDSDLIAASLFKKLISIRGSLMLVGGKPGVDEGVKDKLQSHYPGLNILNTYHGFGDFEPKVADIVARNPDMVLVDIGAPRQEAFMLALAQAGYKGFAISCTDYFVEYLAETEVCPAWIEHWNLRFFWRVYNTPISAWNSKLGSYYYFLMQASKALLAKYGLLRPAEAENAAS